MKKDEIEKKLDSQALTIPVYVDTNAVLDLLASIEGGFSMVEKVTTRGASSKNTEGEVKGEFGVANVLSLLKIDLGASRIAKKGEESSEERESERYHTYGSLVHRLLRILQDAALVKTFDGSAEAWKTMKPSDFVELRGVFRPNPLSDSLNNIDKLMGIVRLSAEFPSSNPQQSKKNSQQKEDIRQLDQLRKFFDGLRTDVSEKDLKLFVVDLSASPNHKAVVTLFQEYLRDQTLRELSHREFRLLGKVVGKLSEDSHEQIELLQGTGMGALSENLLNQMLDLFGQLATQGLNLPKVVTRVSAPALQVIPIAIYV